MRTEIVFSSGDRIAVIAPHPDDESLGASSALLLAPERTDIFVLTDGSHGCRDRTVEKEAAVRRRQFEAEMDYVKPNSFEWIGVEDTKLGLHPEAVGKIDFTPYTIIFLPWLNSLHPDHRDAARFCLDEIRRQRARADCYFYEIDAPFHDPSHYIDISEIAEEKRRLVRFHADQKGHEQITLALNAYRAAQMIKYKSLEYVEAFQKVDADEHPELPDQDRKEI